MDEGNGTREPKVYVRFGPLPTQEIPIEWAEAMLFNWYKTHQPQFSKALADAAVRGGER